MADPATGAVTAPITIKIRQQEPAGEHSLTVAGDVDVSALKGMIEQVCGVPALTQRLIHRGRVLKDDQRVDNARLTDGDTILLVQRPPDAPAAPNGPTAQGVGSVVGGGVNTNAATNGGWPDNLVHVGEIGRAHV